MNRAYDLTAAIKNLPESDELAKAVRKFHASVSVTLDLENARTYLETITSMETPDAKSASIVAALLTSAIVTYARASHSDAVDRYKVGVTKAYSKEQKTAHQAIVDMRNNVIAHFGSGDGWHDERVICLVTPQGSGVSCVHRRTNNDNLLVRSMMELLEVAIPYVKQLQAERADELSEVLFRLSPGINALVDAHPFDYVSFYKDIPDAEDKFWGPKGFSHNHNEITGARPRSPLIS